MSAGRAAPEGPVVAVLAGHDHLEEHALVVAAGLEVLEGVVVAEVMGCLDQRHRRVVEVADGGVEDVGLGDVVGVEDQDQLAAGVVEGVVDVAGLGVLVGGPGQVAGPEPLGQRADVLTAPVVEDPGDVRIGDPVAPDQGGPEHVQTLVVGADEDVDARPPSDGRRVETGTRQAKKANEPAWPSRTPRRQEDDEHDRLRALPVSATRHTR